MLVDGKQKIAHQLVLFVHQHLFISLLLFVSSEIAWKPPIYDWLLESQVEAEELNKSQSVGMNIVLGLSFSSYFWPL